MGRGCIFTRNILINWQEFPEFDVENIVNCFSFSIGRSSSRSTEVVEGIQQRINVSPN